MRHVVAVALASAVFVALLAGAEAATRRRKVSPELSRRYVHLSSGIVAAYLPVLMSFAEISALAFLFIPFMFVSRRIGLFPAVHAVERSTLGEIYFPLGVLLTALLFPRAAPYSYGILVMGVSDALAGLVGQRFGRRGYRVPGGRKTYLGSAAFLASTVVLSAGALLATGGSWPTSLALAVVLGTVLTVSEGVLGGGADNVVLPVAAAGLLALVQ